MLQQKDYPLHTKNLFESELQILEAGWSSKRIQSIIKRSKNRSKQEIQLFINKQQNTNSGCEFTSIKAKLI